MRIATLALLLASVPASAEHLPGGSIITRCLGGNQHEITLELWRECTGAPMISQSLTFSNSCGVTFTLNNIPLISVENVSPVCPDQIDQTTCNGGPLIGIELYTYRTTLFLSPCNFWTISWSTCCRNEAINLNGSEGIYIEALLNNAGGACNDSPVFTDPVPPYVCIDQPVSHDLGVTAAPGQQLRFRFIEARRYTPQVIPVDYQPPYTGAEPFTGMQIDSLTGNISFTPTLQGYIVAVVEVRFSDANGNWIGTVMRDFPFVAQSCANLVPDATSGTVENASGTATITGDYSLSVCGGSLCFDAVVVDGDAGQSLTLTSNVAQVLPGAEFSVTGSNPSTATVCWDSDGAAPGTYGFTINAVDDACPLVGSQTFTYTITVGLNDANAGEDAAASICVGSYIDLTELVTGDSGGTWDNGPIVSEAGTYTYTVSGSCAADQALFTVVVVEPSSAGESSTASVCPQAEAFTLLDSLAGQVDAGGAWTYEGTPVSGTFDPSADPAGDYCYTVSNPVCGDASACLSIAMLDALDPYCLSLGTVARASSRLLVHPNPSTGLLVLDGGLFIRIDVLDGSGRFVWSAPWVPGNMILELPAALANGSYALRMLRADGSLASVRFELLR